MPLTGLLNAVNYFRKKAPSQMFDCVLSAPLCHMYYYGHNEVYLRQYIYSLWKQPFRDVPRNYRKFLKDKKGVLKDFIFLVELQAASLQLY